MSDYSGYGDIWDFYDNYTGGGFDTGFDPATFDPAIDPTFVFNPRTDSDQATADLGLTPADVSSYSSSPMWESVMKALGLTPTTAGLLAGGVGLSALMGGQQADTGYKGGIPYLTANRTMLPIPPSTSTPVTGTQLRRPGSGGVTYFSPMTYTRGTSNPGLAAPVAAAPTPTTVTPTPTETPESTGGLARGGIASLAKGRLLSGPGNGTSDSIPASIDGHQPAALADGEYVIPARLVSELGNGSTQAGARQLDAMMQRIQKRRNKTVGKNKVAFDAKARNELPA